MAKNRVTECWLRFVRALPHSDCDHFFVTSRRDKGEKLHACIASFKVRVEEHKNILPEPVFCWVLLRRSSLDDAETALITCQVGRNMVFQDMVDALETTFGQESVVKCREP